MQQEQKVTNLRTKKSPGPGPVARKPVRNSTSLSSPGNESPSSGPAGDVGLQSPPESPVPKVPEDPPIDVLYEEIGEIFRRNDYRRSPNDNIPTYENLPKNFPPSKTESIVDVDSDDRTYVNQKHLRLAAKQLADVSSKNSVTNEVPRHGTYVKIRSQTSVKSDISSDAKEPELDVESGEFDECYEIMGNVDLFLKSSNKSTIPSEPVVIPTERGPPETAAAAAAAATSLQSRRPPQTQQEDCDVKLPTTAKQTSKDKLNIKTAICEFTNSLMKEIRGAAHRNAPAADGVATRWTSVSQIPANVDQFTIDQVSQCLRLLNLDRYVAPFRERKMNGTFLAKASEEMLMQHFQMDALEAQQLVMFAQQGWRPK